MKAMILVGLVLVLPQAVDASQGETPAAPLPNIVVFLVDDMGVMDTSVPFLTDSSGKPVRYPLNDYYRTPNMQRLADRGVRFNQFYAMSVCSPTRISIMTGQNAARHRTTNWINPDSNNGGPQSPSEWNWQGLRAGSGTLPKLLKHQGYETIHVGKGHFGPRNSEGSDPTRLGFDVNVAGASFGAPGSYYAQERFGNITPRRSKPSPNAVPHLEKYHDTDIFLTEALTKEANARVTSAVQSGKPFFLHFAHYAVHAPFQSDPRFANHYKDSGKSPQAQAFATLVEGMDRSLGEVIDHLDRLGVSGNTLFLFLGDNGSDAPLGHEHSVASSAPLRGRKGSHYEGGMRVPFIAAWLKPEPSNRSQQKLPITPGSIQHQVASVTDLFPTILGLVGEPIPSGHAVDGGRLDLLLAGKPDPTRKERFLMHYPHSPHRSDYFTVLREGPWKVIYHYIPSSVSGGSHYQLFQLDQDPFEQTDLARTHPGELQRMMRLLKEGLSEQKAVYPLSTDRSQPLEPMIP